MEVKRNRSIQSPDPPPYTPLKTAFTPRNLPSKLDSHTYVHTRASSAHRDVTKRLRSADILARKRSKARLIQLLDSLKTVEATRYAERLRDCGTTFKMISCGDHLSQLHNLSRCDLRFCPFCAARRSRKAMRQYLPKIGAWMRYAPVPVTPCLLTLTQTHRQGESVNESRKRLYAAFRKLIRRDVWKAHFLGGLWSFEAVLSKEDGCWHAHMHLIVFRRRFVSDLDGFKRAWTEVTGDACVLNLQRIDDLKAGVKEAFKYITKPADFDRMKSDHIAQLLELRGKRLFNAFGEFKDFCKTYEVTDEDRAECFDQETFDLKDGDPCPVCSQPVIEIVGTFDEISDLCFRIESRSAKARGSPGV